MYQLGDAFANGRGKEVVAPRRKQRAQGRRHGSRGDSEEDVGGDVDPGTEEGGGMAGEAAFALCRRAHGMVHPGRAFTVWLPARPRGTFRPVTVRCYYFGNMEIN